MRQAEKRGNKKDRDDGDEKDDSMSEDEEMIPNAEMPIEGNSNCFSIGEKATTPELTEEKKVKIGSPKLGNRRYPPSIFKNRKKSPKKKKNSKKKN